MFKMTSSAIAAALFFGASSLAMAQSTTSAPSATPAPIERSAPGSTNLSGSSSAMMNEAQVKQRLEADGYSSVSDVRKDKDGWSAKAMHNGKNVTVDIDNSGKIESK